MMFKKSDDKNIGMYLSKKIKDCKYKSARQFCRDWLIEENIEPDNVELQRRSNKLSQIKKGTKSIQIDDLPIFTKLLGITCEEILSAGKSFVPDDDRMTNYKFAFSTDESLWEAYIKRNDNLILNTDEYEKTVIDYALQFKNYKLLKYLTDKKYIWFVSEGNGDYFTSFRAGTNIQRKPYQIPGMEHLIRENDALRRKMISLAIENQDFDMLTTLKAREIPTLYQTTFYSNRPIDCRSYYDEDMIEAVATADEKTLDYFTEEFEIKGRWDRANTFMFPFASELVDILIKNNSKYLDKILNRCIEHNKNALNKLKELVISEEQDIVAYTHMPNDMFSEKFLEQKRADARALSVEFLEFFDVDGMLHFSKSNYKNGVITNVICVSEKSNSPQISKKIAHLNEIYDQIKNFKENVKYGK